MRLLISFWFCTFYAFAVCGGSSPHWTAASTSAADVSDCVSAASTGDTIYVPAGSATWSSAITVAKELTILAVGHDRSMAAITSHSGGASGQTNITCSGSCFILSHAHNIRVAGFNFITGTIEGTGLPAAGKAFRVDHNSFRAASWTINNSHGGCQTPMRHPTTLWDNNHFYNYSIHTQGTNCLRIEGNYQDQLWAQDPPFGQGDGVVYVEDNVFDGNNTINWMDGNYGARYVARFNTIKAGGGYWEVHSIQGNNRANQMWEKYKNTYEGSGTFFGGGFIRSGSGFYWGNRVPSGFNTTKVNNIRSNTGCTADGVCATSGPCNGSSSWDQNTSGQNGWGCRDQFGRAKDNTLWMTGAAYAQDLIPVYWWENITGTSTLYNFTLHDGGSQTSYLSTHVQANRDYYIQSASFNGTTGVGVGTLANRPSACTTGVAYWATDQGEWNSRNPGSDGQLYRCTAPNSWSLYYTPYTYPHPLREESGPAARKLNSSGGVRFTGNVRTP